MEEVEARIYVGGKLQTVEIYRLGDYVVVDFRDFRLYRRWHGVGYTITRWEKAYLYTAAGGQSWAMNEEGQAGHPRSSITLLNDTCLVEVEGLLVGARYSSPYLIMKVKDADAFLDWFMPPEKEADLLG